MYIWPVRRLEYMWMWHNKDLILCVLLFFSFPIVKNTHNVRLLICYSTHPHKVEFGSESRWILINFWESLNYCCWNYDVQARGNRLKLLMISLAQKDFKFVKFTGTVFLQPKIMWIALEYLYTSIYVIHKLVGWTEVQRKANSSLSM